MTDYSRRRVLQTSAALGAASVVPFGSMADEGEHGDGHSPHLEKFVAEMPVPEKRDADGWHRGAEHHEIPIEETTHQFHPDLGETTIWGFDGQFPGPILEGTQYRPMKLEFDNSGLPDEHLFEVDTFVEGTTTENYVDYDGAVPEVRNSTHVHGGNVPTASDGQADQWISPDGVEGPRFETNVQTIPHRQDRMTSLYHDHTRGITRLNAYAGLAGPYYIKGWWEKHMGLPEGEYDVPLVLADKSFHDDGELAYPDEFVANFAGDVATVNGAAWPYFEVEPRRYRFRILNPSNGRTYGLGLSNEDGDHAPTMHQISPGHGFLEDVVSIGHGEDMHSLTIAPYERAEVIVDFSEFAGETITVTNDAAFPYSGGGAHDSGMDMGGDGMDMGSGGNSSDSGMDMGGNSSDGTSGGNSSDGGTGGGGHHDGGSSDHPQIDQIMQFRVAEEASGWDHTAAPSDLRLPRRRGPDPEDAAETRQISMEMKMGSDPGLHTINGKRWGDGIEIEPQLGSTEVWEVENTSMHTHPLHLHLVDFEVLGRGSDGTDDPYPNERGGKDVVRVAPDETVRIAAKFGDFTGKYPFHCHVLEHEEHDMMRMFRVVDDDDGGRGRGDDDGDRGRGRNRDRDRDRDRGRDRDRNRGRDRDRDRNRDRGRGRDRDRDRN